MLLVATLTKALIEIALFSLLAQGLVGLFSPSTRAQNPVYRLLAVLTAPVNRVVRAVMPRFVLDAHVPLVSVFFLVLLWLASVVMKVAALQP